MKTKIQARFVIGYQNGDHAILENAEVVYENDKILFVGHEFPDPVDQTISAGDAIVSPGFVDLNALGDIDHDILHFEAPSEIAKGLIWSDEYVAKGTQDILSPEEEKLKNTYAFIQLIRNGITTAMPITSVLHNAWTRSYEELEQAVLIATRLGLRVYLGLSYQSGVRTTKPDGTWQVHWQVEKGESGLHSAVNFIKNFDGANNGLIRGFLAPERIETITPDLLRTSKQFSDELNCPIRLHAAQGLFEYQEIKSRHNQTPISFLSDIGFLGPRTLIPHAIFTTGSRAVIENSSDDLKKLACSDTSIIHCPLIMARHGMILDTFERYKHAGINIALGTDTYPPDMIENIRIGNLLTKVVEADPSAGSAADFFRAATLGGAKALKRDDLGKISAGAQADIIIIDLSGFHIGQIDDPIKTLVYGGHGSDVRTSIINGRVVMWERQIPGYDLDFLRDEAQECFSKIKAGYSTRDYLHRSSGELFPSSFPLIVNSKRQGWQLSD